MRKKRPASAWSGLGYVGLPLAVEFAAAGFTVVGIDIDADKVAQVNAGESYIKDVPGTSLAPLVAAGRLRATTDYAVVAELDDQHLRARPLNKTKDPDVSYVVNAADAIAALSTRPAGGAGEQYLSRYDRRGDPAAPGCRRWYGGGAHSGASARYRSATTPATTLNGVIGGVRPNAP